MGGAFLGPFSLAGNVRASRYGYGQNYQKYELL